MPTTTTTTDPNEYRHIFRTFLGIVPDVDTPPICGADLAREWTGHGKPNCPQCETERARLITEGGRR